MKEGKNKKAARCWNTEAAYTSHICMTKLLQTFQEGNLRRGGASNE